METLVEQAFAAQAAALTVLRTEFVADDDPHPCSGMPFGGPPEAVYVSCSFDLPVTNVATGKPTTARSGRGQMAAVVEVTEIVEDDWTPLRTRAAELAGRVERALRTDPSLGGVASYLGYQTIAGREFPIDESQGRVVVILTYELHLTISA